MRKVISLVLLTFCVTACGLFKRKVSEPVIVKTVVHDTTILVQKDTTFIHVRKDTVIDNKELFLSITSQLQGYDVLYHIKPIQIEVPVTHITQGRQRLTHREYKLEKLKLKQIAKTSRTQIRQENKTSRTQIKESSKSTFCHKVRFTVIGFIIGFLIGKYIKYIIGILKLTAVLFITSYGYTQTIDTVITKQTNYKSYISNQYFAPLYVEYMLYHGGGSCNRANDRFVNDTQISCGKDSDYQSSGYDKGHLANAEDFAYDCKLQEATFRYYNCIPQTPNLNRGIWKVWEETIRIESQSDSLLIICGAKYGKKKIGNVPVPTYCFKIVKSLSTGKVIHVLWFTNKDKDNTVQEITLEQLTDKKHLGYSILTK